MKEFARQAQRAEQEPHGTFSKMRYAWDEQRGAYLCRDGAEIPIPRGKPGKAEPASKKPGLESRVSYARDAELRTLQPEALVSGARVSRSMKEILSGPEGARTIVFPKTVRTVRRGSFRSIRSLRSAVLNEGLETLGTCAPGEPRAFGGYAFAESGLRSARLPKTLRELPQYTFQECKNLRRVRFAEGLEIIGTGAFQESGIVDAIFPASLRRVSRRAFRQCGRLRRASFADGLEILGERAIGDQLDFGVFEGSALEVVELPKTLKRIEYSAFEGCRGLRTIDLPEGLEYVGYRCFCESGLEAVALPPSVRFVAPYAFQCCESLRSALLNEGLEALGGEESVCGNVVRGHVFAGSGLESVRTPSTLREVPEGTFLECGKLRSVQFSDGLERIGRCAFQESGVEDLAFPGSLRVVSQGAFCFCYDLRSARFSEGLEVLGTDEPDKWSQRHGAFCGSSLERVWLPSTLRVLGAATFADCRCLEDTRLPARLKSVGERCFCNCALGSLELPSSVEEIGERAFYANVLWEVRFERGSRLRVVGDYAFGGNELLDAEGVSFPAGAWVSEAAFDSASDSEEEEEEELSGAAGSYSEGYSDGYSY